MFGKRPGGQSAPQLAPKKATAPDSFAPAGAPAAPAAPPPPPAATAEPVRRSDEYYQTKSLIFGALIEAIDLSQLSKLDAENAREEIRDIVNEIIAIKNVVMSISEQEDLLEDICNDVLGYGPLEPLLARDDIADIMVNGATRTFIEVSGKIQLTNVRFRDNAQLMNICQRIVSQVGRRVDEASPICDARLLDGSRVNVIAPPLAIDGPALTIRKFKKDKLTLDQLCRFGSISPEGSEILKIIGRVRCNVLISGGTGSGKTTLLNCLTNYIDLDERVITCEDAAELQLQQPHVVRLETRPPNLEGQGAVTMRDLVKNCLRMRPERIIVGEVRGPEAFDLLQAMNTGHDGSMGTLHANSPREALSRLEFDDHHGRLCAAAAHDPRDDRLVGRRYRPGRPPARRLPPHHPYHRGDGSRRRRGHHPGPVPLRHRRRGRQRQAEGAASLHGHRPSALLGSRALFRRGRTPCRRPRRLGGARMTAFDLRAILIVVLCVVSVAGGFYVFVFPYLSGEALAEKRHAQITNGAGGRRAGAERVIDSATRRKQVTESLKELEQRHAEKKKISLETRIAQSGLDLTRTNFIAASAGSALAVTVLLFLITGSPLLSVAGVVIGGWGLPNFVLKFVTNRRLKKFGIEFPNAIDVIIRGVKAGLPLNDCVRIIASEASEPVRSEFRQIVEAQTLGLTITEAIERLPQRIPTPEANFFAIVIAIQQKSGGNLAEALSNLSRVLRERKKMRDKVKAISSEAKASAMIIGALPIIVALLVYLTSPHYIELLWTTDTGRVVLAICAGVMTLGCFIMQKMIAFDI